MDTGLVIDCIENFNRSIAIPAWGIVVCQSNRELLRHVSGYADYGKTVPFTDRHVLWLYSLTKVATCTAAVQLVERGMLRLEDDVADYLPAFQNPQVLQNGVLRPAKRPITILDLFTMRAGLNYELSPLYSADDGDADTIAKIARQPLDFDPGERFQYSLCHDVLAGVISVASQTPYPVWLQTELFAPLGMSETRFAAKSSERSPFCAQYTYETGRVEPLAMENDYVLSSRYHSGGAGLTSTLDDYHKLLDALANEGMGANGARILKPESVRMIAQNRLTPEQTKVQLAWRRDYGYGLGMRTRVMDENNPRRYAEIGWDGAAGSYGMADLTNHISVTYVQHVRRCAVSFDVLHYAIRDTVYQSLGLL